VLRKLVLPVREKHQPEHKVGDKKTLDNGAVGQWQKVKKQKNW
jgi:hypothetical protein